MDRSVQDHEVTMLAALHSFITNGDARSEKVVDWYMQAQLAIDSQQVADFLSGLGEKEPAERVLMAMSVMYGYTTLSCLEVAKDMFEELVEMDPRGTAHSYLAAFYMTPWINEVDKKRAVAIYREGVKRGSAACMSSLGLLLEKSTDEYRNVEEALALYRRAASLGCAHGINNWAVHLLNKNNQCPQGLTLLKQAADLGEADACYSYSQLMQWSDRRQAVRYMQRAVNSGMVGMQEEAQKAVSTNCDYQMHSLTLLCPS